MNNSTNIRKLGFGAHYDLWLEVHPDAIPKAELYRLVRDGDGLGKPISAERLAKLCMTKKTTMLKWLQIIKEELKEAK